MSKFKDLEELVAEVRDLIGLPKEEEPYIPEVDGVSTEGIFQVEMEFVELMFFYKRINPRPQLFLKHYYDYSHLLFFYEGIIYSARIFLEEVVE